MSSLACVTTYCRIHSSGDDHAKIQFRELVSVGFAHKFR